MTSIVGLLYDMRSKKEHAWDYDGSSITVWKDAKAIYLGREEIIELRREYKSDPHGPVVWNEEHSVKVFNIPVYEVRADSHIVVVYEMRQLAG